MMLAFAECERGMIGERASEGMRRRIRQGGKRGKASRKDVNVGLAVDLL
ncbi:MAG: recombinase family protein [Euryarchaeota archaeon]|nr:recombinase family protein [Euryarchaeota archaeon]